MRAKNKWTWLYFDSSYRCIVTYGEVIWLKTGSKKPLKTAVYSPVFICHLFGPQKGRNYKRGASGFYTTPDILPVKQVF